MGSGRGATKYKLDLVPPELIVSRYFSQEQAAVDDLAVASEKATSEVEQYIEEHAVDEGLLADAMDDDKISKVLVAARLRQVLADDGDSEELAALQHLQELYKNEGDAKKVLREAQASLDLATLKKYGDLSQADVQSLVLDDKWFATVSHRVQACVVSLTNALVTRVEVLGDRYELTLGNLQSRSATLDEQLLANLKKMGVQ